MSVNKYLPHVLILPEDDANRQLANGFQLDHGLNTRSMQVLPEAGGWQEVLNRFQSDHVPEMDRNPKRFMVLLIDFDGRDDRLDAANAAIPDRLREKVFILGAWNNPEELRANLGNYETIGMMLARECRDNIEEAWSHKLLRHNIGELRRLRMQVRRILFPET